MTMSIPNGIKTGWWSIELPGYRPFPQLTTYWLFPYEALPPIRETLDDDFAWLMREPAKQRSLAEGADCDGNQPDLGKLTAIADAAGLRLPAAFVRFMESPKLQRRIRSCTDCYLDVGDHAVRTRGALPGHLLHFLSDSQVCVHWYLHVDEAGAARVMCSTEAYGVDYADGGPDDEIDLAQTGVLHCSPGFVEFMYRFWIENEIWFALRWDKRPLTAVEQSYADHYGKPAP